MSKPVTHSLIYELAPIIRRIGGYEKGVKLYKNGTIVLGDVDIVNPPQLNVMFVLNPSLFMFAHIEAENNKDDLGCSVISRDKDMKKAQLAVNNDFYYKDVIFDSKKDDIKQYTSVCYYFINDSLKMKKGKIAAHVAHVSRMMTRNLIEIGAINDYQYKLWERSGCRTVVCKVSQEELLKLKDMGKEESGDKTKTRVYHTVDMGLTQIPAGSLTVVGFAPNFVMNLPDFSKYKLL